MLVCALERRLTYCFECDDFPCDKLEAFAGDGYDHHRIIVENMRRMREIGLDARLNEQSEPVYCPDGASSSACGVACGLPPGHSSIVVQAPRTVRP